MSAFLFLLVKLNLVMGAAIVLVALLRRPLRLLFGAPIGYAIWLLVPIASIASLFPPRVAAPAFAPIASVHVPAAPISATSHIAHSALRVTDLLTGQNVLMSPAITAPPPASVYGTPDFALLLFAAWALGALLMALYLTWLQLRFSAAVRVGEAGPAVLGFMRPRIVTPDGFQEHFTLQEQAAILTHERVHLARQDARINALTAFLRCLCWFNPLIHLGAHWLRIDQELACDATAVAGGISRRDYAKALLKSQMVVTALPLGCNWPGSQHPLVERVVLLKRKAPGTARRLAGVSFVVLAATSAGLGAWAAQPPAATKPMDARQPGMALTGPDQPVADTNPAGSGNDVDASKNSHASRAVSVASAPVAQMQAKVAPPPNTQRIIEEEPITRAGSVLNEPNRDSGPSQGTIRTSHSQIEAMARSQPETLSVPLPDLPRSLPTESLVKLPLIASNDAPAQPLTHGASARQVQTAMNSGEAMLAKARSNEAPTADASYRANSRFIVCQPPQLVELSKQLGRNLCVQYDIVANLDVTVSALEKAARLLVQRPTVNRSSGDPNAISCYEEHQQSATRLRSPLACAHNSYWASLHQKQNSEFVFLQPFHSARTP